MQEDLIREFKSKETELIMRINELESQMILSIERMNSRKEEIKAKLEKTGELYKNIHNIVFDLSERVEEI